MTEQLFTDLFDDRKAVHMSKPRRLRVVDTRSRPRHRHRLRDELSDETWAAILSVVSVLALLVIAALVYWWLLPWLTEPVVGRQP